MDEKISAYVSESRGKGYDDAQIKTALLQSGYNETDIDEALNMSAGSVGFGEAAEDKPEKAGIKELFNRFFVPIMIGAVVILSILGFLLFFVF